MMGVRRIVTSEHEMELVEAIRAEEEEEDEEEDMILSMSFFGGEF